MSKKINMGWHKSAYGDIVAVYEGVRISITPTAFGSGKYRVRTSNGKSFYNQFFNTLREAKKAGIKYAVS